uniref:Serpentine receptor class gamma n=1 Tax=Rhabditophanes sp. KR3021 TaxID=114890 RepID=A0AC35U823_9BILA
MNETEEILILRIQKFFPFVTAYLTIASLVYHFLIAIIMCPLYAVIIIGIFKRRHTSEFNSVFFKTAIISGVIDLLFFLDHFITGTCALYPPLASLIAPTTPTIWLGTVFFFGYWCAYTLDLLALYISVNRFFVILSPIRGNIIFDRTFYYVMVFLACLAAAPNWFHIVSPAFFTIQCNNYTNNIPIATFTNIPIEGYEKTATNNSVMILVALSSTTLVMNLMTFGAIIYRIRGQHIIKMEIKLAIYSIFLFVSQQSYTCLFYTGYFGGNLPDMSISYFAKVIKPWAYVIFCLTPAISLMCLSKNVRSIVIEFVKEGKIESINKIGTTTQIKTIKQIATASPRRLNVV